MKLPQLMLDEQASLVHSTQFSSKNAVKAMETTGRYLVVTNESNDC
jgi:hypothetical protein